MASRAEALVVDASVATKWFLSDEVDTYAAAFVLPQFGRGEIALHAPAYIRYEVPAAITAATLGTHPRITQEDAQEALSEFLLLQLETHESDELIWAAFSLVHQHGIALYDGLYVALSQELDLPFITADHKLYDRIRILPGMMWLAAYTH
jgi:predicted nucleic acid-binding protein